MREAVPIVMATERGAYKAYAMGLIGNDNTLVYTTIKEQPHLGFESSEEAINFVLSRFNSSADFTNYARHIKSGRSFNKEWDHIPVVLNLALENDSESLPTKGEIPKWLSYLHSSGVCIDEDQGVLLLSTLGAALGNSFTEIVELLERTYASYEQRLLDKPLSEMTVPELSRAKFLLESLSSQLKVEFSIRQEQQANQSDKQNK